MPEKIVLPAGVYPVRILSCDLHDFKKGGQGFRFRFKPTAPEHKEATLTFWLAFDHANDIYLKKGKKLIQELWFSIGQQGSWEDAKFASATFEGGQCAIKLGVQEDNREEGATQNTFDGAWNMDGKKYKAPSNEERASKPVPADDDVPF